MLRSLIRVSLDRPLIVLGAALAVVGAALYHLPDHPLDVLPEVEAPTVLIQAEVEGLTPEDVEQLVAVPIEAAVSGLPGVDTVRSGSALGLAMIQVQFAWDVEIERARQRVLEGLARAQEALPESAHVELAPASGILGEIMLVSLSVDPDSEQPADSLELRAYAEFDLARRILSTPGVAQVVALGGRLPEFQVRVDPEQLRKWDLTMRDVQEAAARASTLRGAGYLPSVDGRELVVQHNGQIQSAEELGRAWVADRSGTPIRLEDVADVRLDGAPARGNASESGRPAVVLGVKKAPHSNTLGVTESIDRVLDAAEATLPDGMTLNRNVMRQATFIERSLDNVRMALRDAALFVAVVLVLFLWNVRASIVTLTALPLSLALAFLALWWFGLSLNVMTLGGLAVALGEVVDDAIIDVENVHRRLRENALRPPGEQASEWRVVFDACNEVRSSVVYATVIIVLVFLPLLFLGGVQGQIFRPLGLAYIAAIVASLAVALTVTPVLCLKLLKIKGEGEHRDGWLVRAVLRGYRPLLSLALRARAVVLGGSVLLTLGALLLGTRFGTSFLPDLQEGTLTVFVFTPPGTSLSESDRLAGAVERELTAIEGVDHVVRRTGRAERDAHAEPISNSEIEVGYSADADEQHIRREVDAVLARWSGVATQVGQPISHRLSHVLSGETAAVAVELYGEDPAKLRDAARDVEDALRTLPGARDVAAPKQATVTMASVRYRPEALQRFGLTRADAAEQVANAFAGHVAGRVFLGSRSIDVVVRLHEQSRANLDEVRGLLLERPLGGWVRLSDVASVGPIEGAMAIQRENLKRKAVVTCNVAEGENLGDLVADAREVVTPVAHLHGVSVEFGGQFEAQQEATRTLMLFGGASLLIMFALLTTAFRSALAAGLVLLNLPLALIGGIVAVLLGGDSGPMDAVRGVLGLGGEVPVLSVASLVGFITLFGIAVRNGVLLVNHYRVLESQGLSVKDAVWTGSQDRLIPITMTALTAVLGLIPLAASAGEPGAEIVAPLARVVLGGLITSTLLNAFVVPVAYQWLFGRREVAAGAATAA